MIGFISNCAAVGGLYLVVWVLRAIYRIYFHPLSRYPGPLLAAVSKPWYEWYWNFHKKGELLFEIERQHSRLGPVIRIAPNELHINDPEVFQDITKVGSRFIKDPWFYGFVTFPGTSIGETDPSKHRVRRLVLTPAFSPQRVHELAPMVKEKTDFLLHRFSEISAAGKPVNIFNATKAFTMDIISQIIFGKELKCMEDPNFRNQFIEFLHATFNMGWLAPAFPNVFKFFFSMPDWIATRLFPIPLHEFKKQSLGLVEDYLRQRNAPIVDDSSATKEQKKEFDRSIVIDTLLDPKAAKDHSVLDADQLAAEVIMLLSAGNDTASNAMIVGIYQTLRNPTVYRTLTDELKHFFPNVRDEITYDKAKRLPYLSAVIKELLRYSSPLPGRAPRVVPLEGYDLHGHYLEPGTIINTSAYLLNRHPDIWEKPDYFMPERWLKEDSAHLDKYMASFYRGTRQCLGRDLAYCELYTLFANLFRRFELEIYQTTDEDMKWIDLLLTYFTGRNFHAIVKERLA